MNPGVSLRLVAHCRVGVRFGLLAFLAARSALTAAQPPSPWEAILRQVAAELPFVCYGDFLYDREPRDFTEGRQVQQTWDKLDRTLKLDLSIDELASIIDDPDPKLRTLALLGLYRLEDQQAIPLIHSLLHDDAPAIPAREEAIGGIPQPAGTFESVGTNPRKIGDVAAMMLRAIGYESGTLVPEDEAKAFAEWSAVRVGNQHWIGWYDFLHLRAVGGTSSPGLERKAPMAAFRRKLLALPPAVRARFLMGLAESVWWLVSPGEVAVSNESEVLTGARELGSETLLEIVRAGPQDLRLPNFADPPGRGARFILQHAKELFHDADASELLAMGHFVAAADVRPAKAPAWIRVALDAWYHEHQEWDRARAVAALFDLCGDAETAFVVEWFYGTPARPSSSSPQSVFLQEVQRRKPKTWQATVRTLVAHPRFDRLPWLELVSFAMMLDAVEAKPVTPAALLDQQAEHELRNHLRAHFGVAPVEKSRLAIPERITTEPSWSVVVDRTVSSLAVSPDGARVAVGLDPGDARLLDATNGRTVAELAVPGRYVQVEFPSADSRLLTLSSMGELREWSAQGELLGTAIAVASESAVIQVYGSGARGGLRSLRDRNPATRALHGDRLVAHSTSAPALELRHAPSGRVVARLDGHAGPVVRASFSPDGRWLLTVGEDFKVMLWDGQTGELRREFLSAAACWGAVAFTVDSRRFIVGSDGGEMALYDVASGEAVHAFLVQGSAATEIVPSADGRHLYSVTPGWGDWPAQRVRVGPPPQAVATAGLLTYTTSTEVGGPIKQTARLDCWSLPES